MNRNYPLTIGITGCLFFAVLAIVGPYLPGIDAELTERTYYKEFWNFPPLPPSADFWLGTDRLGRDVLSYLVIGTRHTLGTVLGISIPVFICAMLIAVWAAHSKKANAVLTAWNYLFSRVPLLFIVMFVSLIPLFIVSENRIFWIMGFIVLFETGKVAEVMKKSIKSVHQMDCYDAAIVLGTRIKGLFTGYYWPLCSPQWISHFFTHLGNMLFLIGQLGVFHIFLSHELNQIGFMLYEIKETAIEWPVYISNVLVDIDRAPWIPVSAAAFIGIAMLSFFSLGEGIRRHSYQKQHGMKKERRPFWSRMFRTAPIWNNIEK